MRLEQPEQLLRGEGVGEIPDKEQGVGMAVGGTQLAAIVACTAQPVKLLRCCLRIREEDANWRE